jgi:hypothetical protein
MRASGYLVVAATYVAAALITFEIIARFDLDQEGLPMIMAAIVATNVGALLWHRRSADSPLRQVKLGLGLALLVSAVAFALVFQAATGRLTFPEVTIPIAAVGSFAFPFFITGSLWKALTQAGQAKRE